MQYKHIAIYDIVIEIFMISELFKLNEYLTGFSLTWENKLSYIEF